MYNEKNSNESNHSALGTILKTAGVIGVAYLAYQKRDKVNQGWQGVKSSTYKLAEGIKSSSNKFQDYLHNKTEDATEAFNSLSTDIEDKYHTLEGDARDTYSTQLKSLRDKLNSMIDSNEKAIKENQSNSNSNNALGSSGEVRSLHRTGTTTITH